MHLRSIVLVLAAAVANAAPEAPALPAARVTLHLEIPADDAGPAAAARDGAWKMVVVNEDEVPVRLAADARLLTLEIQAPEPPPAEAKAGVKAKPKGPPEPIVCKLPASLRPVGVADDRALILAPHARYEEVIQPALYCFDQRSARALSAGSNLTAKLGFPAPPARGPKKPLDPPFVVQPSTHDASVSPIKELAAEPIALVNAAGGSEERIYGDASSPGGDVDDHAPRLELSTLARVDADSELTIGMSFNVKNTGERPATVHIRRDNLLFDVDGPDGPSHCGTPASRRRVPQENYSVLRPGASQGLDVWVGEMCPDIVFDRPGLYRIWPTLTFPNPTDTRAVQNWTTPVRTAVPILVRILRGRLPFYAEPPRVLSGSP